MADPARIGVDYRQIVGEIDLQFHAAVLGHPPERFNRLQDECPGRDILKGHLLPTGLHAADIEEINEEWVEKQGRLWDELNSEGREVFIQRGGKIIMLSKEENTRWADRLRPILDDYVKEMKSKGLPGDEALRFCIEYLKTHQK